MLNVCQSIAFFFVAGTLLFTIADAFAYQAPPAKLVGSTSTVGCLEMTTGWLGDRPQGTGTGNKGPALSIKNNCTYRVHLEDVFVGKKPGEMASGLPISGQVLSALGIYSSAEMERANDGAITLFFGDTLTLPIEYGDYYKITVAGGWIFTTDIAIEGRMINPRSAEQVISSLLQGVEGRAPAEQLILARAYLRDGAEHDGAAAEKWMTKAAEGGDSDAVYELGYNFQTGAFGTPDYAASEKWLKLAAEDSTNNFQGYAAEKLGELYEFGLGTPIDYDTAIKWYNKSLETDNWDTPFRIGIMYMEGRGLPQDNKKAYFWLAHAHTSAGGEKAREAAYRLSAEDKAAVDKQVEATRSTGLRNYTADRP